MKVLVTGMALCVAAWLAAPLGASSGDGVSAEEEVRRTLEEIDAAVKECRIDDYAGYWAPDGSMFTSSGTPLMSASEYLDVWRGVCAAGGGIVTQEVSREIRILGETALAIGTTDYTFDDGAGAEHSGTTRFSLLLQAGPDAWRIVHAHGSELGAHRDLEQGADGD